MSDLLKVIVLAIVQGVAEFLPISSSGHLLVFGKLLDTKHEALLLTIVLHAGTLFAILLFYRRDLLDLAKPDKRHVVGLVAIGTAPLVFIGVALHSLLKSHYENVWVAAGGFTCTAVCLILIHRDQEGASLEDITWRQALVIGLVQCVAILPGVSRSGSTIAAATRLGVAPQAAARFSFFLAIPAICGAVVLEAKDLFGGAEAAAAMGELAIGLLVAFGVGFLSLKLLIETLKRGKLVYFGYYCLALAGAVVAKQFAG
jgi:undecaprenyl-diphosphatase